MQSSMGNLLHNRTSKAARCQHDEEHDSAAADSVLEFGEIRIYDYNDECRRSYRRSDLCHLQGL